MLKFGCRSCRIPRLSTAEAAELLAVDGALDRVAARNKRTTRVVELPLFGGLSAPETAKSLGTSNRNVERELARARPYLQRVLSPDGFSPEAFRLRGRRGMGKDFWLWSLQCRCAWTCAVRFAKAAIPWGGQA